jgi:hypothetical protein
MEVDISLGPGQICVGPPGKDGFGEPMGIRILEKRQHQATGQRDDDEACPRGALPVSPCLAEDVLSGLCELSLGQTAFPAPYPNHTIPHEYMN